MRSLNLGRCDCFAVRLDGRWVGVCRYGADEYRTIAGYARRQEAVWAAREVAAKLAGKEVHQTA